MKTEHLHEPITPYVRKDFPVLSETLTVGEALATIREHGVGERIVYFYVADEGGRLVGVVPSRRLLTAPLDQRLTDVMVRRVVAIPEGATLVDALEYFILHRFLAFPVVNDEGRIVGVVDVSQFTDDVFDLSEREQTDAVFETIGFRLSQVRGESPVRAFRYRFPWLVATMTGGTLCAFLAGAYQTTLETAIVIAFFLTLVLGLGESVSMQSMTTAIHALYGVQAAGKWYWRALKREAATGLMLGGACGAIIGLIAWVWQGSLKAGLVIGVSLVLSMLTACFLGLTIPWALHRARLDPKIAAGPVALALADIATLVVYFTLAYVAYIVLAAG